MAIARAKMISERFGGRSAATGGKGSMRRKKFYTYNTAASRNVVEINRLMKKNSGSVIPDIESAYMMMDTGEVILFNSPKVELSTTANMCLLTGPSEKKHQNECIDELASFLIAMGNAADYEAYRSRVEQQCHHHPPEQIMEAAASKKSELGCSTDCMQFKRIHSISNDAYKFFKSPLNTITLCDTALLVEAVEQSFLQELYYGKVQLDPFGHVSNLMCCSAWNAFVLTHSHSRC